MQLDLWEETNLAWSKNFRGPLLLIYYKDFKTFTEKNIRKILNFAEYPINEEMLKCALTNKDGKHKRKKETSRFDLYTAEMIKQIDARTKAAYDMLGR